jgi:SAM-dependent methyltransferase
MRKSYDIIGVNYSDLRKPDPRIADVIERALGPAKTVLNVGAGAGSYEPAGSRVTAIEPSMEMIRQRRVPAASVIQGHAEDLPFDDKSFDASMAILTVHHWTDKEKGLREMRRVTRGRIVILTYDPSFREYWLEDDGLRGLARAGRDQPRSNSARLHGRFPERLLAPSRGLSRSTGAGCHVVLLGSGRRNRCVEQA